MKPIKSGIDYWMDENWHPRMARDKNHVANLVRRHKVKPCHPLFNLVVFECDDYFRINWAYQKHTN